MSRTLVFAAVSGLMLSTALAQAPSARTAAPTASPTIATTPEVVPEPSGDEWLASKLKGTAVVGSDNQKIGEISDVLFDKMDHVKAYIVSVGGFLGIGAKEVALDPSAFMEMPRIEGRPGEKQFVVLQMKLSMTKDQLKQMAEFKPPSNSPTTTGAGPSPSPPVDTGAPKAPPGANK
jgi:hypothetical protein